MKDKLLTLGGFDRAKVWIEAALQDLQRTLAQHDVHVYRELTGTAAVTATPYTHAKWDVVDDSVTEYRDGMIVCVKVPVAGHGTYGTGLQINSLGYKPVVFNVNSMISTRYSVGAVVWAVYNATQTASLYIDSTAAVTVTGCWQVQDYDTNTNTIGYQLRTNSSTRPVSSATYRYRLMFSSLDNSKWVPATNSTSSNATSARTVNQEVINPWGRIIYYGTTTTMTAGQSLSTSTQWDRYIFNLGYSFNDGSDLALTYPGPVYIKCTPQSGGGAIIDSTTPYTQTLPSTADGKIYIYLGQAYSASEVELIDYHPVLYHDGSKIAMWMGTSDFFDCVMTEENGGWSCDKNWLEIYNAHVNGKQIRLKHDADIYMPIIIQGALAYFGYNATVNDEGTLLVFSNAFIFDLNGEMGQAGWSHQESISTPFSFSDKAKLNDIEAGAQVNVKSDWNATSGDAQILNKPTIPEAVSGANDGTNWTSLTIGNTTKAIPQGGASLPSISNNAGKVLAVNSNADGLEWVNQSGGGGGLSNYDFTHVNPTVSGSTATITFSANQRGSAMMGVSSDIGLTIACNNGSDNYIWVKNIGSAEIDVTINAVTKNGTAVSYVYVPSDGITVPAGGVCEIGVIVNSDGAFITSRNDLAL